LLWTDRGACTAPDPDGAVPRDRGGCLARSAGSAGQSDHAEFGPAFVKTTVWPAFRVGSDRRCVSLLAQGGVSAGDFNGGADRRVRRNGSGIPGDEDHARRLFRRANQRVIHGSARDADWCQDEGRVAADVHARCDRVLEIAASSAAGSAGFMRASPGSLVRTE